MKKHNRRYKDSVFVDFFSIENIAQATGLSQAEVEAIK